jgi:hypothetical protein
MRCPLRIILIAAATFVPVGGCVSEPPKPEVTPTSPLSSSPIAQGNSGAGAVAGGGASADRLSGAAAGAGVPPAPAQAAEERRAALDKQLNDSLGSPDGRLRKAQQRIAQERDAGQVTFAASTTSGDPVKTSKRGETRSPHAGDLKSGKSAGGPNGNASGNGAVANERPDGNDDDVVARRLRKAADQETDLELKGKLWKEYVEYKKSTELK